MERFEHAKSVGSCNTGNERSVFLVNGQKIERFKHVKPVCSYHTGDGKSVFSYKHGEDVLPQKSEIDMLRVHDARILDLENKLSVLQTSLTNSQEMIRALEWQIAGGLTMQNRPMCVDESRRSRRQHVEGIEHWGRGLDQGGKGLGNPTNGLGGNGKYYSGGFLANGICRDGRRYVGGVVVETEEEV